jgi:hypothetical protein
MTYRTPFGGVNIRGGKLVIQVVKNATVISMIEGQSTVLGGGADMGGHSLRDGQQAVVTAGAPGQPPVVKIQSIPGNDMPSLEAKCTMACNAKKTVYFVAVPAYSRQQAAAATPPITAFDHDTATTLSQATTTANPTTTTAQPPPTPTQTIVAVPTVPTTLPVQYTVSPATL